MSYRIETDSLGKVKIHKDKLWGAQTQRSLENFKIGQDIMPIELVKALALVKECCATVNSKKGLLNKRKAQWIKIAGQEVQKGLLDDHFPLSVWQTGSGTQTNMNVNEVIANRAIQLSKGKIGDKSIHPNDDVNKSQSSNDTVPSAMRIALYLFTQQKLLPALSLFEKSLKLKTKEFHSIIKTGRTHLMDAVPLSLSQEFSAFHQQIVSNKKRIESQLDDLLLLPIGGTAVGTGLNTFPQFSEKVCELIRKKTGWPFKSAQNKFSEISNHDCLAELSGSLKTLAVSLTKIANDIRLLASGPRCGLGELILPANEPGSSIMPGKVNPTQCEALSMLCIQVIGQDLNVSLGGASGQLQLNAYKPLIFFNCLRSLRLLSDGLNNFREKALNGLKANKEKIKQNLENSLMLVTALNPHIGYDKASQIAKSAYQNNITLKEAAKQLGFLTEKEFEQLVQAKNMIKANLK
ncbi:MAG: class II fumarate hydratase [Oligoflexia bacterium]|nr:class II fumarate hydratase [Oligoflexia bacterium]